MPSIIDAHQTTRLAILTAVCSYLFFIVKHSTQQQQHSDKSPRCHNHRNSKRLPNIDRLLRIWYNFSIIYHAILTLKFSVLIALEFKQLKEYRHLSCLLVGRLMLNGRVTHLTDYIGLNISSFLLVWNVVMFKVRPNFRLDCLQFILYELHELEAFEAKHNRSDLDSRHRTFTGRHNSLLELQNSLPLASESTGGSVVLMRPNRTVEAWRSLRRILLVFLLPSLVFFAITALLVAPMPLSLSLTRPGFESSYPQCTSWIRNNTNHLSFYQRYIYKPLVANSTRAASLPIARLLPFANFCPANLYHILRISMDALDNLFIWTTCLMAYLCNSTVAVLLGADLRLYSEQVDRMLKEFISTLPSRSTHVEHPLRAVRGRPASPQHEARVANLQAIILDHFDLVRDYNQFVSFHGCYSIAVWLLFSAFVSSWLYTPGDQTSARGGLLERHLLHSCSTFYIFVIMAAYSGSRTVSRASFRLVASAAALDPSCGAAKQRWLTILKLYWPRSLYCFTILSSIEISWLLMLKMAAWLVSFVLIISSFLVVYTARGASTDQVLFQTLPGLSDHAKGLI